MLSGQGDVAFSVVRMSVPARKSQTALLVPSAFAGAMPSKRSFARLDPFVRGPFALRPGVFGPRRFHWSKTPAHNANGMWIVGGPNGKHANCWLDWTRSFVGRLHSAPAFSARAVPRVKNAGAQCKRYVNCWETQWKTCKLLDPVRKI